MKITNLIPRLLCVCWRRCVLFSLLVALLGAVPSPALSQAVEWVQQLGTSSDDCSYAVSADGLGNVYISGRWGNPSDGYSNAFVSKYDASGTLQWNKQLGTDNPLSPVSVECRSNGVSADGLGNVYISGSTPGMLEGWNDSGEDMFVSKFDAMGTLVWTKQWGTDGDVLSSGVSADGLGNVYISSFSAGQGVSFYNGAIISKYDDSGALLWSKYHFPFGYSSDDTVSSGVSADGFGNVYVSGYTVSLSLSAVKTFLSKFDASGTLLWTEQVGTGTGTASKSVSADGLGNVYVSGITTDSLEGPNAGEGDAFLSKYDALGTLLWTKQLGTSSTDGSLDVSADDLGNVYITGETAGSLGGLNDGGYDAFVSKYDATGALLWTQQLGTADDDTSYGVSADGLGNVYFAGCTEGSLGGPSAGGTDAFVGKICDVPEPSTFVGLMGLCLAGLLRLGRRGRFGER